MALALGSKTSIKGRIFIPMNGLNYVTIGNEPFAGEQVNENNIALAEKNPRK